MSWKKHNQHLIRQLQDEHAIQSSAVANAFAATPRHLFVPQASLADAYGNHVIGLKTNASGVATSTLSQPAMIAIMLEQLDLRPGQRVLEIGAGTGYNAALMGAIVGPSGHVVTLDIDDDLVMAARQHLRTAHVENVTAYTVDGGNGYPDGAPYDRIILTTSAHDIAPAWIEQLATDGRLVLPLMVTQDIQYSIAFDRHADYLASNTHFRCRFVALRGNYATPDVGRRFPINAHTYLAGTDSLPFSYQHIETMLHQPQRTMTSAVQAPFHHITHGLDLWLMLNLPHTYSLVSNQEPPPFAPLLVFQNPTQYATLVHITDESMATLSRQPAEPPVPSSLMITQYGQNETASTAMLATIDAWQRAQQPTERALRFWITAAPRYEINPNYIVLEKGNYSLVIAWQNR